MNIISKGERGIAIIMVLLIVFGVVVAGAAGTAAVILSDDLKITVTNQSCGTWDIAAGTEKFNLNFIPGINVPSSIAQGETAVIQVPKRFVESVTVTSGSIELRAFDRSFSLATSHIDMESSQLNGRALSEYVGQEIDLEVEHTLIMECR